MECVVTFIDSKGFEAVGDCLQSTFKFYSTFSHVLIKYGIKISYQITEIVIKKMNIQQMQ